MVVPIFSEKFVEKSLNLFKRQYHENDLYRGFSDHLNRTPSSVERLDQIPFLPIELFKYHKIYSGSNQPELEFKSSGTSEGMDSRSTHYIDSTQRYTDSITTGFKGFFDLRHNRPLKLFALLPGYMENQQSSLIHMMEVLVEQKLVERGGYYLNDLEKLNADLKKELTAGQRTILLWGVSFALLDFVEQFPMNLENHIVLETGGMKGKRREMVRQELHDIISDRLGIQKVYSEYGMTELLSQAYSDGDGVFWPSNSMAVLGRDMYDPLQYVEEGQNGGLNIVDLNNQSSCGFIATQDMGRVYSNGSFEVIGRLDHSDVRGCNLMAL